MLLKPHQKLYVVAFLIDTAIMIAGTALPFFIFYHLGGGAPMSGAISALQSASYAFYCLLLAKFVAQAKNALRLAVWGCGLYGILFFLLPWFRSVWFLVAVSLVALLGMSLAWPAMQAWFGGEPDLRLRAKRISFFNVSWSLGFAVGPLLAGPLYDLDYRLPFILLFVLMVVSALLLARMPREERRTNSAADASGDDSEDQLPQHDIKSEIYLYPTWAANLVGWAMVGACSSVFPKRVDDLVNAGALTVHIPWLLGLEHALGAATLFSWLSFLLSAARAGAFLLMGHSHAWHHRFWISGVLQLAAGAALGVLAVTERFSVMALCYVLVGVNGGACFFTSLYYSLANREHRHFRASLNEGMVGSGGFLGSMGFGLLAGYYGVSLPFLAWPVIACVAVAFEFGLLSYRRRLADAGELRV